MSRVAVTGGAGFLGSHIVKRLIDDGREVSVIDDFSAGSLQNLADLGVKVKCAVGDLRDYEFARKSLRKAETVFHFAAEVGSVSYLHGSNARELAALQANLVIDANVFKEACLRTRSRDGDLRVERLGLPLRRAARLPRAVQGGGLRAQGEPGRGLRLGEVRR